MALKRKWRENGEYYITITANLTNQIIYSRRRRRRRRVFSSSLAPRRRKRKAKS